MGEKPVYIDYSALVAELKKLCNEKRTGSFFITTGDKHAAFMTLDEGRLVGCRYRGKSGNDALDLIKDINTGITRFVEGNISSVRVVSLPSTDEILNTLSRASHAMQGDSPEARQSVVLGGEAIDTATIDSIKSDLAHYLGPVAGMCCEDYEEEHGEARTQTQAMDMVYALAQEIDSGVKQQQFIEQAKERLSN